MTLITMVAAGIFAVVALGTTVYTCLKPKAKQTVKIEIVKEPKITEKKEDKI